MFTLMVLALHKTHILSSEQIVQRMSSGIKRGGMKILGISCENAWDFIIIIIICNTGRTCDGRGGGGQGAQVCLVISVVFFLRNMQVKKEREIEKRDDWQANCQNRVHLRT